MSTIQSLDRAISILKCFESRTELGVTEISALVGLNTTTAYNIIHTLTANGFLEQNEQTRRYVLGVELLRIGAQYQRGLRELCLPWMQELSAQTGETVNLVHRVGHLATYIEKVESPHSMRICTEIGARYPLHCSAVGQVLLAFLDAAESKKLLTQIELKPFTARSITDRDVLWDRLQLVRANGYAEEHEEMIEGVVCVAVPLLNSVFRPIAALSVSGPITRMTAEACQDIRDRLIHTAAIIHPLLH